MTATERSLRGLLIDFGGVLTTNVFQSFRSFCEAEGLAPNAFADLLRSSPETRAELRRLETAQIGADEFGAYLAPLLGIADADGLMTRIFAGIGPEPAMIDAVRSARRTGIRTGLISNSVGTDIYDRAVLDELFDAIVISGEVGLHKPQPEIFLLGAERIGLPPERCVFVDDLRENCAGAEAVGMTALLHRGPERTLPELKRLLGNGKYSQ
ncbi:MAG TPA: HAD family phosphatase [Thermoleophilaceae bacterium]|nr:HAD family phosphatase [Thermoleophilaceae bacterium]